MKHKRGIIIAIVIAAILAVIPIGLYAAGNYYFSDARIMEGNWNIVLPANIKEKYAKNGPTDFQGHGSRYVIFEIKKSDLKIMNGSSNKKNNDMEDSVNSILNDISVEKSQYPDFSGNYQWKVFQKYTYKLYMVFDDSKSLLYLIQDMP